MFAFTRYAKHSINPIYRTYFDFAYMIYKYSFILPFLSLQHFVSFSWPSALRNYNKMLKRSNTKFFYLKGKVFNIKYGVCSGIWIFYQIKEACFNSQGIFFFNSWKDAEFIKLFFCILLWFFSFGRLYWLMSKF